MWVWLLMCTVLLWLVLFRFKRRRMIKLASKLPTLKGDLPFLGVAHTLCGNSEAIMEQMKSYSYEAMQHDGLVSGWCGPFLFYGMVNPVDLEYVLKTCMDKSNFHKFSRIVVGNGGIFAPVSIWRRRRKVLVPTFSPKILETFVQVFSKKSQKLVEVLEKKVGRGPVSMWPYLSSYTFDSVCETALGVTVQALENPKTPFLEAMNRLLELVCLRTFHLWLHPDWIYRMLPQHRQHLYHLNVMHKFTDEVIENKRKEIDAAKKAETVQQEDLNSSDYKAKAFLDHMIQLSGDKGDGFTNIELREEVMTFALAGTDTSAVAVGFTLMLLAKYPHIQEKVYQELYEVFGDSDRPIVKEDLMKLKYLERVVKESLRLFPPVPIILRQVDNDVKLPSGRVLPAGGIVVILIWGVHRDPKYWGPDVEVFDPDRFLPERFTQTHACNFMPFSQGPRNCVGYQYAMMSIKTALSTLLRRYKIVGEPETSPIPKIKVKLEMMMKAIDEYTVALERREPVIDK